LVLRIPLLSEGGGFSFVPDVHIAESVMPNEDYGKRFFFHLINFAIVGTVSRTT